jgi:two-component system cell cycle response regulator
MIDIDNFKQINDRFGHQTGDEILVKLANLLMESIRGIDIAARYGGEEFVLILPQVDVHSARQMAERLKQRVESYFANMEHQPLRITISQGIATIPHPRINSKADLIRAADKALYQAKRKGKNSVVVSE